MTYRRSRYQNTGDHPLKKFRFIIFLLALILTVGGFAYGGFVGNFIGYMTIGCVSIVGIFYILKFFS